MDDLLVLDKIPIHHLLLQKYLEKNYHQLHHYQQLLHMVEVMQMDLELNMMDLLMD
tara:strand:- start:139 stop:306 length:168 start_codon:yes stop_codon:yes gene_type:complete